MNYALAAGIVLGVAVVAYTLHRLALHAERRGWLYYKTKRGSAGALAFMEIASIYDPQIVHEIEELRHGDLRVTDDESGEGAPGGDEGN